MKYRILFVDDEPQILEGLKRMLRPMRNEWDMNFAIGGQAALSVMKKISFDVIISDIRMPSMNGVQLLTEIQHLYPHTIRILLSGQSDENMSFRAVGPAHQYLAKPCDAELLKSTISRVCMLGDLLGNTTIKHFVSQIETIPSSPDLYRKLEQELQSKESSLERASAIIAKDVGMSAKILKLANSAFFGTPKRVANPLEAVFLLGMETLKTLVLTIKIFQEIGSNLPKAFDVEKFWEESLNTGEYAREIMATELGEGPYSELALTAGILHDLGVLLLACNFPDKYQECLTLSQNQNIPLVEAERQILGTTHGEVGGYLLGLWGLCTPIVEAVAFHHDPQKCPHHEFSPLTVVHVANAFVNQERGRHSLEGGADNLNEKYLIQLGIMDRVPVWQKELQSPLAPNSKRRRMGWTRFC